MAGGPRAADALGPLALLAVAAIVPLLGAADAWIHRALEAWRTCGGLLLAERVSDLVMPVGVGLLAVAVGRALWRGRPAPLEIAWVLAALGAGVFLVGELKNFFDRPRPGAEFLASGGGSFPSGHVGNTVLNGLAILTLWSGGVRGGTRWRGWLVLGAAVAIVAAARVYERRHWPSDTLGSLAVAGAFGLLAIRHPEARWRRATTLIGLTLAVLAQLSVARGVKLGLPAGTQAGRAAPAAHVAFGTAYERGWLRGDWALDGPDPRRRSAWLRSEAGELVLPAPDRGIDEVRLVARPRSDLPPDACPRLRVALNGRVLGEPVLQLGWRAYVFPTDRQDFHAGSNALTVEVRGDAGVRPGTTARRAAFSELSLHAAPAASP